MSFIRSFAVMVLGNAILASLLFPSEKEVFPGEILKKNGGWCWFQDERALVINGKVFFSSVKIPEGDIDVSEWNINGGKVITHILAKNFNADDHASAALLELPDGKILAAWSSHGNSPVKENNGVLFYAKTAQKCDASDWEQTKAYSSKGCYNNLFILSGEGGRIYDFSRSYGFNPNWYYSDDGGEIFKYGGRFLFWKFDPLDPKKTPYDGNRPYVKYASDNVSTIHFATTEDHPRGYDNSIYHGYVRAGKMFDSFGNEIAPLSKDRDWAPKPTDFTKVFAGDADNVAWVSDFHLDGAGNPVIVFSVQKNCGKLRHIRDHQALDMRYFYARWDGKKWFCAQMAFAGTALYDVECDYTGLCALNPADVDTVYISTNSDPQTNSPLVSSADGKRHYEIYRGRTKDGGKTWIWTPITENSSVDNLRPIAAYGSQKGKSVLLWLRGVLNTYTSYSLDVAGMLDEYK